MLIDHLEDLIDDLSVYEEGLMELCSKLSPSMKEETLNLVEKMSQMRIFLDDYLETLSKLYPEFFELLK